MCGYARWGEIAPPNRTPYRRGGPITRGWSRDSLAFHRLRVPLSTEARQWIFLAFFFGREILRKFWWEFCRFFREQKRTQEGCGGLRGENPGAFPKARPIFQQPFSLPENAQPLTGIAFCAAGKSVNNFPAASKFAGKPFQQRISDSHSLLEYFADFYKGWKIWGFETLGGVSVKSLLMGFS